MPDAPLAGCCNCVYFECGTMSDKFKSLDANEKTLRGSLLRWNRIASIFADTRRVRGDFEPPFTGKDEHPC
jgi:hypothetical protein